MAAGELSFATIGGLRVLLDSRAVSSLELTRHVLGRLERIGRPLHAIATMLPDRALTEAARADAAIARGMRGPLLGIPYGAKDLLAARGGPTMWGSAAYRDQVLDEDAGPIDRLRKSGAVLAAKLATMELAGFHGTVAEASIHGPGLNPWDRTRWSAGSSSGSGAAVGAGLVPFALGTETGGSIGSPSAFCGLTGLRPTFGLVGRYGVMPLVWSLDKVGPMARSVTDCALVLEVISGYDRRDDDSVRRRFRRHQIEDVRASREGPWRIGISRFDLEEGADASIRGALDRGLQAFEDLGVEFVEEALPSQIPYDDIILWVLNGEGAAAHGALLDSERLGLIADREQQNRMRGALATTARTYVEAMRARRGIRAAFDQIFGRVDAILTYTVPWEPWPIEQPFERIRAKGGFSSMVAASNLAELPALFLPVGLSDNGLPVGMQLVGPRFSEATLVALGEEFQASTEFHLLRPFVEAPA